MIEWDMSGTTGDYGGACVGAGLGLDGMECQDVACHLLCPPSQ